MNKLFKVPNDHNIYSALNTGKVSDSALNQLFLSRGILISTKTDKEQRAAYFASFLHGFCDYELISAQHAKGSKTEFTTSAQLSAKAEFSDILATCSSFEDKIEKNFLNAQISLIETTTINANKLNLKIHYQKYHPDRQMFAQFESKIAIIEIESSNDHLYLEGPSTPEGHKWLETILDLLSKNLGEPKVEMIDLTSLTDPNDYWNFFNSLTDSITGYERSDVLEVTLKKPKDIDSSDDEDDNSGITYRIDSASYKGTQLHRAEEFKTKISEGFHLNKISWDCKEIGNVNSDIFKLCVRLDDISGKKVLSFISKGYLKFNDQKNSHLKNSQPLSHILEKKFNKLIFDTSLKLLNPEPNSSEELEV